MKKIYAREYKKLQDELIGLEKEHSKHYKALKRGTITLEEHTEATRKMSERITEIKQTLPEQAKELAKVNVKFREATKMIESAACSEDLINKATQQAMRLKCADIYSY